ncbi:NAD(P)-dependent oxidoreductase [Roseiconus nitratireducens]|uniref:NAD(P)-dependent oxidoreductase n=1 Tax=Roseiconus nitratireducens TaxID=2605748 RepID=A0A5M6DM53_9BACT|nr:NAD(P)-dependent oxidoreductase [Roseiconus nitratireducens]KAA5547210.1 NAD(P)-dependent oxidoreductase [Roseiconus nitratireducens]
MPPVRSCPDVITDERQLDDWLTTPSAELVRFASKLQGNLLVLGAGGKMGPSLAVLAQRAIDQAGSTARVIAVSRFSDEAARAWLTERNVETLGADLLCPESVAKLPDAERVIYLVGTKFGTGQNPSHTWALNTLPPSYVMRRYGETPIAALSTGNVYAFTGVDSGGSLESDPLRPVGEYANAAVGRERIFDYFSRLNGTPVAQIRLNYATDLRYGVLTDIARKVLSEEPIDVTQGHFNCIWQGDANDCIIRSLALAESPPRPLNLTGPETLSVREVAQTFASLMGRTLRLTGRESETAFLSNSTSLRERLGPPAIPTETLIRWTAHWVQHGGRLLNKPTHFEVRDGAF